MLNPLFQTSARWYYLNLKPITGESASLLKSCWKNVPKVLNPQETPVLSLDLETSSLDPHDGEIISAGWVVIENGEVQLGTAKHLLVSAKSSVGRSATIHNIRDCELQGGISHEQLLIEILKAADSKALLFHNAHLDMAFLNQLSMEYCQAPLLLPCFDSLQIEKNKLLKTADVLPQNSLTLSTCRHRYHLPRYPGHNALVDALATAELFIAQHQQ